MKKSFIHLSTMALCGGVLALYGCSKVTDEVTPQAAAVSQNATTPAANNLKEQNKWLYYLELLEQGRVKDPTGQYVAKALFIDKDDDEQDEDGTRTKGDDRPKFDAATGSSNWGYSDYVAHGGTFDAPRIAACEECLTAEGANTGEGIRPVVAARFASSVGVSPYSSGDNPNGYIYDVKVVKGRSSNLTPLPGYTIIPLDLNAGAGGQYIYLTFTRNPSQVRYGDEKKDEFMGYSNGYRVIGPVRKMMSFSQRFGAAFSQSYSGWHGAVPTWTPYLVGPFAWKQPDLNDGAGGRYIYGYQGKGDNDGNPVEIGVLSGNSSNIAPPPGWRKINGSISSLPGVDLNEGAGGDYIYFCIR